MKKSLFVLGIIFLSIISISLGHFISAYVEDAVKSCGGYSETSPIPYETYKGLMVVPVNPGWNLVPLDYTDEFFDVPTGKSRHDLRAKWSYIYDRENKKYELMNFEYERLRKIAEYLPLFPKEFGKTLNDYDQDLVKYYSRSAIWMYFERDQLPYSEKDEFRRRIDCLIYGSYYEKYGGGWYKDPKSIDWDNLKLTEGWNILTVTPGLLGKKLGGDCKITKVAMWDAPDQKWEVIDSKLFPTTQLTSESEPLANIEEFIGIFFVEDHIGDVLVIKVENDCRINTQSIVPTPPIFPTGEAIKKVR